MTNTGFLVRRRGHQRLDTHRSKMKSHLSSAPGAPGFILPASSLPYASADFPRVWGEERSWIIRCAEGRWKPNYTQDCAPSQHLCRSGSKPKVTFSRGKNKHQATDVRSLHRLLPGGRGPGGGQRGEETLLQSGFGSAGIVSSLLAGMAGASQHAPKPPPS